MKRSILMALMLVFCFSCNDQKDLERYLESGLLDLKNGRNVEKYFIDDFGIKELGIIKENDSTKYLIFKLEDNSNVQTVEKYRMGVLFLLDEHNAKRAGLLDGVKKKSFDFSPKVEIINNNKYIINKIATKIDQVDEISLYIYTHSNNKITKLEKNKISVKKISLL